MRKIGPVANLLADAVAPESLLNHAQIRYLGGLTISERSRRGDDPPASDDSSPAAACTALSRFGGDEPSTNVEGGASRFV
jgi:hypothetical protein